MTAEPIPISRLQPLTPPPLERVVKRCLAKDPDDRWQTAHDLLIQLRWIAEQGFSAGSARRSRREGQEDELARARGTRRRRAAHGRRGVARVSVFARSGAEGRVSVPRVRRRPESPRTSRSRRTARRWRWWLVRTRRSASSLFMRPVGDVKFTARGGHRRRGVAVLVAGQQVGGLCRRRPAEEDRARPAVPPKDLGDATGFTGGTWSKDNVILFGSAADCAACPPRAARQDALTTVEKPETGHFWPRFLPDGTHYLYLSWSDDASKRARHGRVDRLEGQDEADGRRDQRGVRRRLATCCSTATQRCLRSDLTPGRRRSAATRCRSRASVAVQSGERPRQLRCVAERRADLLPGHRRRRGSRRGHDECGRSGFARPSGATSGRRSANRGPYGDFDLSPDGTRVAVTRQDIGRARRGHLGDRLGHATSRRS